MLDADGNDNGIKGVVDASMPDCIREGFVIKTTGARRFEVSLSRGGNLVLMVVLQQARSSGTRK